jgi:hypothetical protein
MKKETTTSAPKVGSSAIVRRHVWEYYRVGDHPKGARGKRCKVCGWSGKLHILTKYGVPECSPNVKADSTANQ